MQEDTRQFGLRPLPKDDRDFQLGAVFDLPALTDLPDHFQFDTLKIKHQGGSDFCTAYSYCAASELQEGVTLEPSWSFAMTKSIEGDHTTWGADLRIAAKAHTAYGALEEADSPYSLENKDPDFLRNPECWPVDLMEDAEKHKKKSFFKVEGPYDPFDNIRAAIWKFRESKQAVVLGLVWGWPITQTNMLTPCETGFGHAVAAIGWSGDYIIIQNSYGTEAGQGGLHYIHRDVINADVKRFGAYMLVDLDREQAEYMIDNGIKDTDNWLIALLKALSTFIRNLWSGITK